MRKNNKLNLNVKLEKNENVDFYGMQLKNMSNDELNDMGIENGIRVLNHRNNTLYRMGVTPGYILIEINGEKISNTSDLSSFDGNVKINQMTFISPDGDRERLIFE